MQPPTPKKLDFRCFFKAIGTISMLPVLPQNGWNLKPCSLSVQAENTKRLIILTLNICLLFSAVIRQRAECSTMTVLNPLSQTKKTHFLSTDYFKIQEFKLIYNTSIGL